MKSIAALPFYFCITIMLLLGCASCGFVHNVFSKSKISVDSIVTVVGDTASAHKKDSMHTVKSDSTGIKKKESGSEAGVEIEFSDTLQSKVSVTIDKSGSQHIEASGKIKSVKTKGSKSKTSVDSTHSAKSDSSKVAASDTAHNTGARAAIVSKKEKDVSRDKKSWRVPWYGYVILFLFIALVLYLAYRKYKSKIVAEIENVASSVHS